MRTESALLSSGWIWLGAEYQITPRYDRQKTNFAIFLCTKISPGLAPVITASGTLESAHPIHRVYIEKLSILSTLMVKETTNMGSLALSGSFEKARFNALDVFGPLGVGGE